MGGGRMQQIPIEIADDRFVIPQNQVGHRRIGAHIRVNSRPMAVPLDRPFDESAVKIFANMVDQRQDTWICTF